MVRSAMILSAGLGSRLRPLTDERAKPVVPVGDRPALAHVLERVRLTGAESIVVNVHHRPDDVAAFARSHGLVVSHEPELLGTAGGLARASGWLGVDDVLVWNGDILSDLDPTELVAAHAAGWDATLAVVRRPKGEGNVGFSAEGRIVRLRAERFGDEDHGGEFMGIHVVGARLRERLPPRGCLVGDVYLPSLRTGGRLGAFVTDAGFSDIGSIHAYVAANRAWLARRGSESFVGDGATLTAPVVDAIVGARARIEGPVARAIVWPGAHVPPGTRIENAVVTTTGIVPFSPPWWGP